MATDIGLIRAVSAANKPYVDYAAGAKSHLEKWYQEKKIDAARLQKEKMAYLKAMQDREKQTANLFAKFKDIDAAKTIPELDIYNNALAVSARNEAAKGAKIGGMQGQAILNNSNKQIELATGVNQDWKEYIGNIKDRDSEFYINDKGQYMRNENTISKANNAFNIAFDGIRNNLSFENILAGNDGRPVYVVSKDQFSDEIKQTKQFQDFFGNKNSVAIPHSEIFKIGALKETQTAKYKEALEKYTHTAIKSMVKSGYDNTEMDDELNRTFDSLKFTEDQLVSIAIDELDILPEEYGGSLEDVLKEIEKEGDQDGKPGIDINDLKVFVKNEFKSGILNTFNKIDTEEETKIPKPTVAEEKKKQTQQNITFATNQLNKIKLPKTSKGMIDVGSTLFNRLLNNLNLSPDAAGSFEANGKQLIKVKSNVTNKTLNFTSDMTEAEFNRAILLLSGATPEEAMAKYPDNQGPVEQDEAINIGSLPVKKS